VRAGQREDDDALSLRRVDGVDGVRVERARLAETGGFVQRRLRELVADVDHGAGAIALYVPARHNALPVAAFSTVMPLWPTMASVDGFSNATASIEPGSPSGSVHCTAPSPTREIFSAWLLPSSMRCTTKTSPSSSTGWPPANRYCGSRNVSLPPRRCSPRLSTCRRLVASAPAVR